MDTQIGTVLGLSVLLLAAFGFVGPAAAETGPTFGEEVNTDWPPGDCFEGPPPCCFIGNWPDGKICIY